MNDKKMLWFYRIDRITDVIAFGIIFAFLAWWTW